MTKIYKIFISIPTLFLIWFVSYGLIFAKGEFVDERDNWVGAYLITQGSMIYKDFLSHHAPLTYLLALPGILISPHTYILQRFFLYLFHSIWLLIVLKRVNKNLRPVVLLSWLFLSLMAPQINTNLFFAESFVATTYTALLFLILNYWLYQKPKLDFLVKIFILVAWIIFWSLPTYIPSLFIALGILVAVAYQKKSHPSLAASKSNLVLITILLSILPGLLIITHSFKPYLWSVYTFNSTYYYKNHLSVHERSSESISQNLSLKPFRYLAEFGSLSLQLHLNLIRTLKNASVLIFTSGDIKTAVNWIRVGLDWWWQRIRPLDVYFFNLLISAFIVTLYYLRGTKFKNLIVGVLLIFLLLSLRIRDIDLFHLSTFFMLAVSLYLFVIWRLWFTRKRPIAALISVPLLGLSLNLLPDFQQLRNRQNGLIPPFINENSLLLQSLMPNLPTASLLNLTGDMTYFLTTTYQPANKIIFYTPSFNDVPEINQMLQYSIQAHRADAILVNNSVRAYAPDLISLIDDQYTKVSPDIYLLK